MLRNKIAKLTILIVLAVVTIGNINNKVYADPMNIMNGSYGEQFNAGLQNPLENPNSWKPDVPNDDKEFNKRANTMLTTINVIGVVSSVIVLVIMGIKYMLGSAEEKADYKKSIIPYIIGMVLLAICSTIPNIIYIATTAIFK